MRPALSRRSIRRCVSPACRLPSARPGKPIVSGSGGSRPRADQIDDAEPTIPAVDEGEMVAVRADLERIRHRHDARHAGPGAPGRRVERGISGCTSAEPLGIEPLPPRRVSGGVLSLRRREAAREPRRAPRRRAPRPGPLAAPICGRRLHAASPQRRLAPQAAVRGNRRTTSWSPLRAPIVQLAAGRWGRKRPDCAPRRLRVVDHRQT